MEFTKKIKDAAEKGVEKASDLGKEVTGKGKEEVEKGKDAATEGYQETKETASEANDKAENYSSDSWVQLFEK